MPIKHLKKLIYIQKYIILDYRRIVYSLPQHVVDAPIVQSFGRKKLINYGKTI